MQLGTFLDGLFSDEVVFPTDVGDILRFPHKEFGDLAWIVSGLTQDGNPVIWMRDALEGFEFDATEARCVCPDGLPAAAVEDRSCGLCFRTMRTVPAGGVIVYRFNPERGVIEGISTYARLEDTEPIETVRVQQTARNARPILELVGAENCNHSDRAVYGSGNFAQSGLFQYINSDAPAGQWWRPMHRFDRPPSYANRPGFLVGFDREFLDRIRPATVRCAVNRIYETDYTAASGAYYDLEARMFLPSYTELSGNQNNGFPEGTKWELISDNEGRRKNGITSGNPVWYWMRSCNPRNSCGARRVNTDGYPGYSAWACNPVNALAAACVIKA